MILPNIAHHRKQQKGALVLQHQAPESTHQRPLPSKVGSIQRRRTMSLSHPSIKKSFPLTPPGLSGPDALRAYFAPRQVLRLKEAALILNLSYSHFFRRIQAGTLGLKIRKNEVGERFVLLDDLILYLFPASGPDSASSAPPPTKKKLGRPRNFMEGGFR